MRHRDRRQPQAIHRHGSRAQERASSDCKGLKQDGGPVGQAIIKALTPFESKVEALTYDNGQEFCGYALIDVALNSTSYFARPFVSWERGTNVDLGFCQNSMVWWGNICRRSV